MPASSPIKVLIGILGLDQHEAGAYAASSLLRDAGMEVIYLGCFQMPKTIVKAALEEDADVIGLSAHSWEYLDYMDELLDSPNDLVQHPNGSIYFTNPTYELGGRPETEPWEGSVRCQFANASHLSARSWRSS